MSNLHLNYIYTEVFNRIKLSFYITKKQIQFLHLLIFRTLLFNRSRFTVSIQTANKQQLKRCCHKDSKLLIYIAISPNIKPQLSSCDTNFLGIGKPDNYSPVIYIPRKRSIAALTVDLMFSLIRRSIRLEWYNHPMKQLYHKKFSLSSVFFKILMIKSDFYASSSKLSTILSQIPYFKHSSEERLHSSLHFLVNVALGIFVFSRIKS